MVVCSLSVSHFLHKIPLLQDPLSALAPPGWRPWLRIIEIKIAWYHLSFKLHTGAVQTLPHGIRAHVDLIGLYRKKRDEMASGFP